VPEGHSIAEVVLHAATWQDVVRRRLQGETPQVSDEEDWPSADGGAAWWKKTQARLFETGAALTKTVEQFPAERLHENRPGLDDTWYGLIIGQLQHGLYHLGQAAVLGKAGSRK
jgi:uncharacterized protein YfaQ (DUF2300 family)